MDGVIGLKLKTGPLRFELQLGDRVGYLPITAEQAEKMAVHLMAEADAEAKITEADREFLTAAGVQA